MNDRPLFQAAWGATVVLLVLIPVQILVFVVTPLPGSVVDWLNLFAHNPALGLVHADLLMLVDNLLILVLYVALAQSLPQASPGLVRLALVLGSVGVAAYAASNRSFELWSVAHEWSLAPEGSSRAALETVARALLAGWQGTAFDVYYVLNGAALLLFAWSMRTSDYGRTTAHWGLAAGVLMVVPSTAGTVGVVFSLASLVPWYVFCVRLAVAFHRWCRRPPSPPVG